MTADEVLDAIARKYPGAVLLRELVAYDPEFDERCKQWTEAGATGPYPTGWNRRIDALMLDGGTCRTAIEVKISRSDFLRETADKRRPWERITDRFIYACPAGLIKADEVPVHCGLWWVHDDGSVTVASRARKNRSVEPIPHEMFVTVAYRLKRWMDMGQREPVGIAEHDAVEVVGHG
ncbi:hypothetical protein [Gordonia malaquae]|uniref:hypothetical protein n=1 Tax=Gordonia malaquae TaxID=410332 RepID=UPI0030174103